MATKNEITGDSIQTKTTSDAFRKGYEGIDFSIKLETPVAQPDISPDKPMESTETK
jgi:hypothetical protein